jgi:hypothetical protein
MAEEQPLTLMTRVRSYSHVRFGEEVDKVDAAVEDRNDLCGTDTSTGAHRYGTPIRGIAIPDVPQ